MQTTFRKLTVVWPLVILLLLPALTRAETAVQAWVQLGNGGFLAVDASNNVTVTGFSATTRYSSAGVPLWTTDFVGPGNGQSLPYAVAVDGNNDVIVTGYSMLSEFYWVYATIKYSSKGLPLWTNSYAGPSDYQDSPNAMVVDGNNDVIIAGYSGFDVWSWGYTTIKYSSLGLPLWTNRYDGPVNSLSYPGAVAIDSNNNVIVTGAAARSDNYTDYGTIKYSRDGVPLWTNRFNPSPNSDSRASGGPVAVDGNNDVIVAGGSDLVYATIKYSSAGVPLWTNLYGPCSSNHPFCGMAVDRSGNVILTGAAVDSAGYSDYVTIKYSGVGAPLWTNLYHGPWKGDDYACAVAVDGSNNVIVTGFSTNGAGRYDYTTMKYSSAGVPLWTNRCNGPMNNIYWGSNVAVDRSGNVIVTGHEPVSGGDSYATIKYICVPSPVLTGLQVTNGTFRLRVDDVLQPGTLVIEACTNLAGWAPVFTNTAPTNVLFYTDPDAGSRAGRFYRAFQFP